MKLQTHAMATDQQSKESLANKQLGLLRQALDLREAHAVGLDELRSDQTQGLVAGGTAALSGARRNILTFE